MRKTSLFAALMVVCLTAIAEEIGTVSTKFKMLGPNDKIVIEVFGDQDIPGIACYLSRAKTGGISGAIGVAEDTSDASIACRQIGPVRLNDEIREGKADGEEVFKKRTSLVFKTMQVVRFYDAPRNVLVYLSYSDRIIEGSPKNSISVVPIQPWPSPISNPTPSSNPGSSSSLGSSEVPEEKATEDQAWPPRRSN